MITKHNNESDGQRRFHSILRGGVGRSVALRMILIWSVSCEPMCLASVFPLMRGECISNVKTCSTLVLVWCISTHQACNHHHHHHHLVISMLGLLKCKLIISLTSQQGKVRSWLAVTSQMTHTLYKKANYYERKISWLLYKMTKESYTHRTF